MLINTIYKMKSFTLLLIVLLIFSCKDENRTNTPSVNKENKVVSSKTNPKTETTKGIITIPFLEDIKSLKNDTTTNPIETFQETAKISAKAIISLNKDTVAPALNQAKDYTYAVITVANHTIIKLNLKDCKPSNAWDACMPKAEGYIKKGDLIYQNDYCNNIIGLPDNQERILYLF